MEETLQISVIEPHKDESFSILCASLEASNRHHVDEAAEAAYLLGIMSNIGCKYNNVALAMATELDKVKELHAAETAKMKRDLEEVHAKLKQVIDERSDELKRHEIEKTALNQRNEFYNRFLASVRDQIDEVFAHVNQSNQILGTQQIEHDVVTVDGSDSEDGESEVGDESERLEEQEQPQAVETDANHVEVVDIDQEALVAEPAQQNLSNGDAHDETVKPNNDDDGKENVRPQSTPIGKAEAPAIAPDVTASMASTVSVASIAVPVSKAITTAAITSAAAAAATSMPKVPLVEKAATENTIESSSSSVGRKKKYSCIFCNKKFPKKAHVFQHWETDHQRAMAKISGPAVKRKHTNNDDEDDDDDEIPPVSNGGHYVSAHNPLKHFVKRQKKNAAKSHRE